MVLVRTTMPEDWRAMREIRLAALRDAPAAFASTYEREVAHGEADWQRWISGGGMFLAYLPEVAASKPAGLAGGYQPESAFVELVSMYVLPSARGRGVGEALIGAVIGWARGRHAGSVHLWVTDTNKHARLLYERCGFSPTGERQPLPSDPAIGEIGMSFPL
jgi:GNAT superfamily N-acetyltransferase